MFSDSVFSFHCPMCVSLSIICLSDLIPLTSISNINNSIFWAHKNVLWCMTFSRIWRRQRHANGKIWTDMWSGRDEEVGEKKNYFQTEKVMITKYSYVLQHKLTYSILTFSRESRRFSLLLSIVLRINRYGSNYRFCAESKKKYDGLFFLRFAPELLLLLPIIPFRYEVNWYMWIYNMLWGLLLHK